MTNILIIKHGALGDIMLAIPAFAAIRKYHNNDKITLLTTNIYEKLLKNSPYFDEILIDKRAKIWNLKELNNIRKIFRNGDFERIYDLQTSRRSTSYYKLLPTPKAEFSGIAKNCSHLHNTAHRAKIHITKRLQEQLQIAGISKILPANIDWLKSNIDIPEKKFSLIIAGGSAHRPAKRWNVENFASLSNILIKKDIMPLLIGTNSEKETLDKIKYLAPSAVNLCGKTSFEDIATLARNAEIAIGNDTGPMHLIATVGCKSITLFAKQESNPTLCSPKSPNDNVKIIAVDNLKNLSVAEVMNYIDFD